MVKIAKKTKKKAKVPVGSAKRSGKGSIPFAGLFGAVGRLAGRVGLRRGGKVEELEEADSEPVDVMVEMVEESESVSGEESVYDPLDVEDEVWPISSVDDGEAHSRSKKKKKRGSKGVGEGGDGGGGGNRSRLVLLVVLLVLVGVVVYMWSMGMVVLPF